MRSRKSRAVFFYMSSGGFLVLLPQQVAALAYGTGWFEMNGPNYYESEVDAVLWRYIQKNGTHVL